MSNKPYINVDTQNIHIKDHVSNDEQAPETIEIKDRIRRYTHLKNGNGVFGIILFLVAFGFAGGFDGTVSSAIRAIIVISLVAWAFEGIRKWNTRLDKHIDNLKK